MEDSPVSAPNEHGLLDYAGIMWDGGRNGAIHMNGHNLSITTAAGTKHKVGTEWKGVESTGLLVNGGTLELKNPGSTVIKAKDNGIHLIGDATDSANLYIQNSGEAANTVTVESEDKGIYRI